MQKAEFQKTPDIALENESDLQQIYHDKDLSVACRFVDNVEHRAKQYKPTDDSVWELAQILETTY